MKQRPQFTIIAGPNGAGKSTHFHPYIPPNTLVFNGDLVYAEMMKKYPNYDPVKLRGGVPYYLEKERDKALRGRSNFGFETNYSAGMAADITNLFKENGYQTKLVYFGIPNLEITFQRVAERVKKGGHKVSPSEIEFNYFEGIKKVNENLHLYDNIQFVDNSHRYAPQLVAMSPALDRQLVILDQNVAWFNELFRESLERLAEQRQTDYLNQRGRDESRILTETSELDT